MSDKEKRAAATQEPKLDSVARLYKHVCEQECCPDRWSEFPSYKDEEDALTKRTSQVPILHHLVYHNKKWITESLVVQSAVMRTVLRKVLHKYQDLDMDLENWKFSPPYRPLVHRWETLKGIGARLINPAEKEAAVSLMEFLTPILKPSVEALTHTKTSGKVKFSDVWQIFPPGVLALTTILGVEAICRVAKYEYKVI